MAETFNFAAVQTQRKALKQQQEQAEAKAFAESLQSDHKNTLERITEIREAAVELRKRGGSDEQLQKPADAIFALAKTFGDRLDQISAFAFQAGRGDEIPSDAGELFIDSQVQLFETSIEAAQLEREDTSEDFVTLSPQEVANLGFPEGAIVQRGPDNKVTLAFDPSENLSTFQERVEALTPFVGKESAVGIAAGRFAVSTNPITNESVVLDKATGGIVGEVKPPSEPEPIPAVVTPGTDPTEAVGAAGFLKNAANIITDSIGQGLAFEGTQQATTALNVIQQQTKLLMQSVVPGKPAQDIREGLKLLTVTPNSIFQGEARAKSRFEGTKRWLDNEIARIENMLQTEISPQDRGTLNANLGPLKEMSRSHQDLINAFDTDEEVDLELEALLDKFAPVEK